MIVSKASLHSFDGSTSLEAIKILHKGLQNKRKEDKMSKILWNSVETSLPENLARVLVVIKDGKYREVDVADYIAPKMVRAEDYLQEDCDDFAKYDEEKDCYWAPAGFYQAEYFTETNYYINEHVTHWKPLPKDLPCTEEKAQPNETK